MILYFYFPQYYLKNVLALGQYKYLNQIESKLYKIDKDFLFIKQLHFKDPALLTK